MDEEKEEKHQWERAHSRIAVVSIILAMVIGIVGAALYFTKPASTTSTEEGVTFTINGKQQIVPYDEIVEVTCVWVSASSKNEVVDVVFESEIGNRYRTSAHVGQYLVGDVVNATPIKKINGISENLLTQHNYILTYVTDIYS